jgi:hypothetical protein
VKAKQEPEYRFYLLYDKVCRDDILAHAYRLSRAARGAAGVDGVAFADIEAAGVEPGLAALRKELCERTYRPAPVRRVLIPKPGGGERPRGIPTIRDRVVQTAAKLVLEPIFEADFEDSAYGYRPRRSAQDAVRAVHAALREGYTEVVDADLSKYFDTIPHQELLQCVARRVTDRHVLRLVKMWLKAPVEERDERGRGRLSGGTRVKAGVRAVLRPGNQARWPEVAADLNRRLRGWATYFASGTRVAAYRAIDHYVVDTVQHFLRRRHQVPTRGTRRFGAQHVFGDLGVVRLTSRVMRSAV